MALSQPQLENVLPASGEDAGNFPCVWMPIEKGDAAACTRLGKLKIRNIGLIEDNRWAIVSIVSILKKSFLGKIYGRYLKRHPLIQSFVWKVWRCVCPLCRKGIAHLFVSKELGRWRLLIKQGQYHQEGERHIYHLAEKAVVRTPKPQSFPFKDRDYLVSPHDHYEFPEVYISRVKNALVYGNTNLILAEEKVIYHDLYDFNRDYTSEEHHLHTFISPKIGRIRWLLHDKKPEPVPAAAVFVDACSHNYAHWMTEVLPRIILFCSDGRFKGVPIVVDEGLHPNIMESLSFVIDSDREVITLGPGRALAIDELYLTSVAGYVPFERRNNKLVGHSHGKFCPQPFRLIRERVFALKDSGKDDVWPEKIFVRRNSGVRNVMNAVEIERLMVSRGFAIVEPERLTFLQQAQLFSKAKIIVGSSGAAMANILYAGKDAKIFVLMSKQHNNIYWYWQNIACAAGNVVCYILGKPEKIERDGIHSDFSVDLDAIKSALSFIN